MSAWKNAPRPLRRTLIQVVAKDDPAFLRRELAEMKKARESGRKSLQLIEEIIQDIEGALGEVSA